VWDIDNPEAEPLFVEMGAPTDRGTISGQWQIQFDGDYVLFHQFPDGFPLGIGITNAALLNVNDGSLTIFTNNPSQHNAPIALANGSFAYPVWKEELDSQSGAAASYRIAIGKVADAPDSTVPRQFDTYAPRETIIDFDGIVTQEECLDPPKLIGYGASICITPDGSRWFLGGAGSLTSDYWEYLQMSTGGAFEDFDDPEDSTMTGSMMATDVSCSSNVVAFRTLRQVDDGLGCSTENEWVVGFLLLDRL
jgi:hypothetical protein